MIAGVKADHFGSCASCHLKSNQCRVAAYIVKLNEHLNIDRISFSKHLLGAYVRAGTVSSALLHHEVIDKPDGCLAVLASLIHDLGHNQELFKCPTFLKNESRHSHFLELFLLQLDCKELAQAVRHSAPQFVFDLLLGSVSLPQLVCCYSDATTDSTGKFISLSERNQAVRERKKISPKMRDENNPLLSIIRL